MFGEYVLRARLAAHLSQAHLAIRARCTRAQIAHLEHGRMKPPLLLTLRLCEVLDLDISEVAHEIAADEATVTE